MELKEIPKTLAPKKNSVKYSVSEHEYATNRMLCWL